MLRFLSCRGKFENRDRSVSAREWPVLKLMNLPMFRHMGPIVTTDNWYTAILLIIILLDWGIYLFGTVRSNRNDLPKDRLFPREGVNKRERGEA